MDHVHQKRQATLRRKKEEEDLAREALLNQKNQEVINFSGAPATVQPPNPSSLSAQPAEWVSDDDDDNWAASETSAVSSHSPSVQLQYTQGASRQAPTLFARPSEAIETTPSGRPYKLWKGKHTKLG
jgi:hypothetical protein